MKEFKAFLLRGNLVDMAVGIVIGLAFVAVVTALVADLITPLIAAVFGSSDFSALTFTIHKSHFLYGSFFNAVFSFVTVATVVFFLIVKPVDALMARRAAPPADQPTKQCPECLSEIPAAARRCAFCTSQV
jgi:large conductance mechanosensitive channel